MSDFIFSRKLWLLLYTAPALFTFGHAGNQYFEHAKNVVLNCEKEIPARVCFDPTGSAFLLTIIATAAWPLYWSLEVQDA